MLKTQGVDVLGEAATKHIAEDMADMAFAELQISGYPGNGDLLSIVVATILQNTILGFGFFGVIDQCHISHNQRQDGGYEQH